MTSKEALDIVNEALEQPDNSVIFKHTFLTELKKVIEKAQKQDAYYEPEETQETNTYDILGGIQNVL